MTPAQTSEIEPEAALWVVPGDQLFPLAHVKPFTGARFYLAEDVGLCTRVRHHKQKIALFLAAMRNHRDALEKAGHPVHYDAIQDPGALGRSAKSEGLYEARLAEWLSQENDRHPSRPIRQLVSFEINDRFFAERLNAFASDHGLERIERASPMFLTPRSVFIEYLNDGRKPKMANFYQQQRHRLDLLMEGPDGSKRPAGGQWSFDADNRLKLPADVAVPGVRPATPTDAVRAVIPLVNQYFADHPGTLTEADWWMPTTRRQALNWLKRFLEQRLAQFGPYEDALSQRDTFLFHGALTPMLNLGLITPAETVDQAIQYASQQNAQDPTAIPINSLEGFVRQVIGWREFVRGIYDHFGPKQETTNFFNAQRRLTDHWYEGTTGVLPLDDVIHKAQRYGWTHHIERLMVAGNLMLTCGIHPQEAHRWFMEMFVDSADWVMGPNVYGMGIFSDGGVFSTKPYLAGSNYILKMSDYAKPKARDANPDLLGPETTWADVMDGLYWRFVEQHLDYFRTNPRLAQITGTLQRMKVERKNHIFGAAERFIARVTC